MFTRVRAPAGQRSTDADQRGLVVQARLTTRAAAWDRDEDTAQRAEVTRGRAIGGGGLRIDQRVERNIADEVGSRGDVDPGGARSWKRVSGMTSERARAPTDSPRSPLVGRALAYRRAHRLWRWAVRAALAGPTTARARIDARRATVAGAHWWRTWLAMAQRMTAPGPRRSSPRP
jgi:hypothetical protein